MSNVIVKKEELSNVCRICLESKPEMLSIYENYSEECKEPIYAMIMYCASVKIAKGDGLPDLVCSICKIRLEVAYLFKRDCEQSEFKLRQNYQFEYDGENESQNYISTNDFEQTSITENSVKVEITETYYYGNTSEDSKTDIFTNSVPFDKTETSKTKNKRKMKKNIRKSKHNNNNSEDGSNSDSDEDYQSELVEVVKPTKRKRKRKSSSETHRKAICYICCAVFSKKDELEGHHANAHHDHQFICDGLNCEQKFTDFLELSKHKQIDHLVVDFLICPVCNHSFQNKKSFTRHIYNLHGERPFGCITCSKTFRTDSDLQKHKDLHTKDVKCDKCDKTFSTKQQMARHTHGNFTCLKCNKMFSSEKNLKRHEYYHPEKRIYRKGEKKHLCSYCGQRFCRPVDLTTHIRTHTGAKPYTCDQCDYKTHDNNLLRSHKRRHTDEKPYKCRYCEKSFAASSYLTIHHRYHSGYRPYICQTCQKGFTNSKDLKVHERTHTGIKLFSCEICQNSFTTLHYLRVHTKKHETGK